MYDAKKLINTELWSDSEQVSFNYSTEVKPSIVKKVIAEKSGHTFFTPEDLLMVKSKSKPFWLCGIKRFERSYAPDDVPAILNEIENAQSKGRSTGIWYSDQKNLVFVDTLRILWSEKAAYKMCVREKQLAVTLVLPDLREAWVVYL